MGDANGSYAAVNGHTTHIDKMNGTTHREDLSPKTTPIAIVGVGCRFGGGVTSPEKLWDLLAQGESTWSEIPPQRYNKEAFYHPDAQKSGAVSSLVQVADNVSTDRYPTVERPWRLLAARRCHPVRSIFL